MERAHNFRNCKCVGYLLDSTKPAADICERLKGMESGDVLDKLRVGLESFFANVESQVVNLFTGRLELGLVENHPSCTALVQEGTGGMSLLQMMLSSTHLRWLGKPSIISSNLWV